MAETPPRKFMFERSFDAGAAARPPERKPVTLKPEQYDALKQESYDAGFVAGKQAGLDQQAAQLSDMVARLDERLTQMTAGMAAFHQQKQEEMKRLALAVARKAIPDFMARNGEQEVEAMLTEVIADMGHEPRLVVRVNEAQFDPINNKIHEIAAQKAYAGSIVVLADPEIACGDCRVEWADGGIERNTEATINDIEEMITASPANPSSTKE